MKRFLKSKKFLLPAVAIALFAALLLPSLLPVPAERGLRSVCLVECRSSYAATLPNGDTLHFFPPVSDTQPDLFRILPGPPSTTQHASGFFMAADGTLATTGALLGGAPDTLPANSLRPLLRREREEIARRREQLADCGRELDYYARTHSVTDEGYNEVMAFGSDNERQLAQADSLLARLDAALAAPHLLAVREDRFAVTFRHLTDSGPAASPPMDARLTARGGDSLLLLRLSTARLPAGASTLSCGPFAALLRQRLSRPVRLLGFLTWDTATAAAPATLPSTLPLEQGVAFMAMAEGGPVTDKAGHLSGMRTPRGMANLRAIWQLCREDRGFFSELSADVAARLSNLFSQGTAAHPAQRHSDTQHAETGRYWGTLSTDSTTYSGSLSQGRPDGEGEMRWADGSVYRGAWRGGRREGRGCFTTAAGSQYIGTWRADTLPEGIRHDAEGFYQGNFDACLRPSGSGRLHTPGSAFYEGGWREGRREGFGFAVEQGHIVRCGTWRAGRFQGERMIYTKERVYGIDISRYQHEKGRRKPPFSWNDLRVTSLGPAGNRHVEGQADYPVSFVFIKATQGTSIRNRYYAADAAQARRKGIPVGAYHFFSTRPGRAQAAFFLKTAQPRPGDLPPVLDMELTERQMAQMGGEKAVFREIMAWMRTVEAACGTKPVLYVSQQFVNRHLPAAPPELREHDVWIARYGQYRPYVRLLFWQLTDRGRVKGIRGDVDINVFNGTRKQFRSYCRQKAVK